LYKASDEGGIALLAGGFPSSMSHSAVSYSSMNCLAMFVLTAVLEGQEP
jgi:hypothetical protein